MPKLFHHLSEELREGHVFQSPAFSVYLGPSLQEAKQEKNREKKEAESKQTEQNRWNVLVIEMYSRYCGRAEEYFQLS